MIAAFELEERLVKDLRALGVKDYALGQVDGRGVHGTRMSGLADAPNMRLEILVGPSLAEKILERIVGKCGPADHGLRPRCRSGPARSLLMLTPVAGPVSPFAPLLRRNVHGGVRRS